jgi:uncharacterized protein YlaI
MCPECLKRMQEETSQFIKEETAEFKRKDLEKTDPAREPKNKAGI